MITIPTKDVSPGVEVKDCFRIECEVSDIHNHEQDYIKSELRIIE